MKNVYLVCFLIFFSLLGMDQDNFSRANTLYYERQFQDALTLYREIDPKSWAVWENMGNCAYYLEDYVHAIVYWKRAQLSLFNFKRYTTLQERIREAECRLTVDDNESWNDTIKVILIGYLSIFPLWFWQILVLLSLVFLVYFFQFFYRTKTGFMMVLVIGFGLLCTAKNYFNQQQTLGIVTSSYAFLRTGADEKFPSLTSLKLGKKIEIVDANQDWCRVFAGIHTGWIQKNTFETI